MIEEKVMEKRKDECFKCGGELKEIDTVVTIGGKSFKARTLKCAKCGQEEFTEKEVKKIRIKAQKAGVWGWGLKMKRRLQKIGRATAVYIPADISKQLKLKPRQEVVISVEGHRMIIEPLKEE